MKFLITTAFLALSINAFANEVVNSITGTTIAPTAGVVGSVACTLNPGGSSEERAICQLVQISGLSTSTTLAIVLLKEDIAQVENDAYNFVAGEPMTLALEEVIAKVRAESAELAGASDAEVVAVMLEIAHAN